MSEEKWYPLCILHKRYSINKRGLIKDEFKDKILKIGRVAGRRYVVLEDESKKDMFPVDELLLNTFVGKIELPITYIDGNLNNTDLDNLTYHLGANVETISSDKIKIADQIFYQIPNFQCYYLSKTGIMYSLPANKLLKRTTSHKSSPYIKFRLSKYSNTSRSKLHKSERYNLYLHHLVFMMFIGDILEDFEVDHIDGNHMNNSYDNLQLLTPEENTRKMKLDGNCRWTIDEVESICKLISHGYSPKRISDALGINDPGTICIMRCNLRKGIIWRDYAIKHNILTDDEGSTTIERIA